MVKFVQNNVNGILLAAFFLGLLMPNPGEHASQAILALLFAIIFLSFFQFNLKIDSVKETLKESIIYSFWRCFLFPLFFAFALIPIRHTDYYVAIFLLSLLPSAVSSPSISGMLKGNYNLSITNLVITSFFVTLSIPLYFLLLFKGTLTINPWILFKTLIFTIILPFFIHLPFRKSTTITHWVQKNLSVFVIICLVLLLLIAIAKNKAAILDDYNYLVYSFLIAMLVYSALYFFGGIVYQNKAKSKLTTFSISSGQNNIGLGIALSTIYFSSQVASFFIVAELAWIVIMFPVKYFFVHFNKTSHE
jgi:predicted Na+-dependent transporter